MTTYLVHAMEGRARLRHPFLAGTAGQERALAALSGRSGVLEARPGSGSILLLLTPDADLDGICRELETALPELCRPADGCRCRSARSGASALSGLLRRGQSASLGLSPRKLELRALLAACGLSIVLGFTGNGAPIWWPGRPSACWPRVTSGPGARPCSISALREAVGWPPECVSTTDLRQ